MVRVPAADVLQVVSDVLAEIGAPDDIATRVATWLVRADTSGHPSHGVIRCRDYANRAANGSLDPAGRPTVRSGGDGGSAILIDGHRGFGMLAADLLTDLLVERAAIHHIAIGGIVNASHTGRLGEWAEKAADRGTILLMCTASLSNDNVAGFGASDGRLGTNPLAAAIPAAEGEHLLVDFATSSIAGGKIQHLIASGGSVPEGALVDRHGSPTTDPKAWLDGGILTTFGGHKGYGLALLIALLGGCVVGQAEPTSDAHGVMMIAIDPGTFAPAEAVIASVTEQLDRMRSAPPLPGIDRVRAPGDPERESRARHGDHVEIEDATWTAILEQVSELGVDT